jgi:hypothetical protein
VINRRGARLGRGRFGLGPRAQRRRIEVVDLPGARLLGHDLTTVPWLAADAEERSGVAPGFSGDNGDSSGSALSRSRPATSATERISAVRANQRPAGAPSLSTAAARGSQANDPSSGSPREDATSSAG